MQGPLSDPKETERHSKSTNNNIKKVDGTVVMSADEQLQRCQEHFQHLLNCDPPRGLDASPSYIDPPSIPMLDEELSIDEIKSAVQSLKNGKVPGIDQMPPEAIKAGGDVLACHLHTLI